jgi:uncharacterized membrane protein YhaH (DUF805 family)
LPQARAIADISQGAALFKAYARYFDFNGRSTRTEFWKYYSFYIILMFLAGVLDSVFDPIEVFSYDLPLFKSIVFCLNIVPLVSCAVRRLHDTGRSGWRIWILLVLVVGEIVLLYWLAQPSSPEANRYRPSTDAEGAAQPEAIASS